MDRAEVLMSGPMMPLIAEQVAERFVLHRLWHEADEDAFLARCGAAVRGLVASPRRVVDAALIDRLPNLEIVSSFGVGYDHVDALHAGTRGVVVTNTPDVLTDEVADLTVALLLMTIRRLPQAERFLRAGRWRERPFPLSPTLRGRRIGIVGLGRIGKAVARRLDAFGVEVVYHGRSRQEDVTHRYYPSLRDMAREVDVLVVVTPGGQGTRHLVDADVLRALGPEGVLVNVSRGSVVDETALIAALRDGTILAAGLDVFENEPHVPDELLALDNAVLLPHVGSASVHTRTAMGQLVVDNLTSWFSGNGPITPVAETPWPGTAR